MSSFLAPVAVICDIVVSFYFFLHLAATLIIIGGGTGLVPNRRQAITWINDDEVYDAIWRH